MADATFFISNLDTPFDGFLNSAVFGVLSGDDSEVFGTSILRFLTA
jgi:hypothetical protein